MSVNIKKTLTRAGLTLALVAGSASAWQAQAADYLIDTKGAHAAVQFKIKHLGYSWLVGRFNRFDGEFSYDAAKPADASITVNIDTSSVDSNHAERDKHLKSKDFLDVKNFPSATFKSTSVNFSDADTGTVTGDLTLHGVKKSISFPIQKIGEGKDPWGGHRAGFEGHTSLKLADYGITYNLGPASTQVEMSLYIEGIRQ
jgi:polyisoprenoid-binding protein YceI